jgi:DNA primase
VLFPVRDRATALVAVHGRHVDNGQPKAHTAGDLKSGVFATPGALAAAHVVITEAPIDALSLATSGVPALALCGTSWPTWLPQACAFRCVAVAFDGDAAGDQAAAKLTPVLQALGATVERWRPAAGKDWNELVQRHGAEALREALCAVGDDERTRTTQQYLPAGARLAGNCPACGRYTWIPGGQPLQDWCCADCRAAL